MTTTMYLNNEREIRAAARAAREAGFITSIPDIKAHDRFVANIVRRLAGADLGLQDQLERVIVEAVAGVRQVRLQRA